MLVFKARKLDENTKECVDKEGVKGLNSGDSNVSRLER